MNETKKDNTEEKILTAAQTVFIHKGMDGARMQEIANEAGINKRKIVRSHFQKSVPANLSQHRHIYPL